MSGPAWNSVPDDSWEAVRNREAARTIEAGGDPCEGCGKPGVVQDINGCDLCQSCADGCALLAPQTTPPTPGDKSRTTPSDGSVS